MGPRAFTPEALDLLSAQPWPGNVRDLSNVIENAVILSDATRIGPDHLAPSLRIASARRPEGSGRRPAVPPLAGLPGISAE